MSAYFLRADAHSICECIQAFGLDGLLFALVGGNTDGGGGGSGGFPCSRGGSPAQERPGMETGPPLSLPCGGLDDGGDDANNQWLTTCTLACLERPVGLPRQC